MNKNEFYKQLMSEYTFDADRIRDNAKRGKSSRQKLSPLYIGMSAAAAACVVTVGTIAAVNMGRHDGVSLTDTGLTTLSANDRLNHALEQLEKERGSTESRDYLVTFAEPMTPAQAQAVLTAEGNIPVRLLYLEDGSRISDTDQIGRIFTGSSDARITGAAVYCSGGFAVKLQNEPAVFLIEAMEAGDFENAAPVNISDIQTSEVTLPEPSVTEPGVVVPPVTSSDSSSTEDSDGTVEPTYDTSEMDGTSEPEETAETEEDEGLPTEEITTPVPEETTPTEPTTPESTTTSPGENTEPDEHVPTLPAGVTLPTNISANTYNTYLNADTAFFISSDIFFTKDANGVSLYRYESGSETLICSEEISDAKIAWASQNGRSLMVTGTGSFGTRSRTLLVSADSESICDLGTDDIVMSGSLNGFGFNESTSQLTLSFKDEGVYYIYSAKLDGTSLGQFTEVTSSDKKLSLVASSGNVIYYNETSSGESTMYAADISTRNARMVHFFEDAPKVTRNLAFTHAVITNADGSIEVFDPATERLLAVSDDSVSFGASRDSFICSGSSWVISGGAVVSDGSLASMAEVEYRRSGSEKWYAYVSGGTVRITDSDYSAENKASLLTFNGVSDNASAELRSTLNGAVGVNNAIALGKYSESGIKTPESLVECISVYYSANASQKIMARCGISPVGTMNYTTGGLKAADAGSMFLVISSQNSDTASGMLYIEAGTFAGKQAYRSVSVEFVKENGAWKLNTII